MCGIIGAAARRDVVPVLLAGLKRLEYRGYDSAGLAVLHGGLQRVRSVGRVAELERLVGRRQSQGSIGIAHTRWATHGAPSERNAHPHTSDESIAVVHNGIIENHGALRDRLTAAGYCFESDTDTEVIVHLIHLYAAGGSDLLAATRQAIGELRGAFALAIVSAEHPERMICVRQGSPLLVGIGDNEHFVASDAAALLPVTRRLIYLEEGDVADISPSACRIVDRDGQEVARPVQVSQLRDDAAELKYFHHFMQKEIHEQPTALANTLAAAVGAGGLDARLFGPGAGVALASARRICILACGTSYHAGAAARYWIESLAGVPCTVEVASEFRYRESVADAGALVVAISQSGETADTMAALSHAMASGYGASLAICNVPESSLVRLADTVFLTAAGPEIGVASTKAFTTQLAALLLFALVLAKQRGRLNPIVELAILHELRHLPLICQAALQLENEVCLWAEKIVRSEHVLFLGRGIHYPIALEGALKLKEITYIHAEGYPAGELKHGPLALVDHGMPVVALAPADGVLDKVKSNLQEVRARGGELFVLTEPGTGLRNEKGLNVISCPHPTGLLAPFAFTVPLQLLAYHSALLKGTDVDKPRNLAKSVTVE